MLNIRPSHAARAAGMESTTGMRRHNGGCCRSQKDAGLSVNNGWAGYTPYLPIFASDGFSYRLLS